MTGQATNRWSISLGSWQGVAVRLHVSLLLMIVLVVAATAHSAPLGGAILLVVTIISLLLHEAAHQAIVTRLSTDGQPIVLTPLGGLRLPSAPNDPEVQLLVGMVGPLVNLSIVVAAAGVLAYSTENLVGVFTLAGPAGLLEGPWPEVALKTALWVNWLTFLASLIPTYPFDGGPALRAALWPLFGQRSAAVFSAQLARLVGLALAVAAVVVLQSSPLRSLTLAAPLGVLAVFVFFSAQHELVIACRTGGVILGGYLENTPLAVSVRRSPAESDGFLLEETIEESWLPQSYDALAGEATEEDALDDILARLHSHGPQDLSEEDRRILQRASRRYRDRRRS